MTYAQCTCPKRSNQQGIVERVACDVLCPVHGNPVQCCSGCMQRDLHIAELEQKLAAFESIVQLPNGQPK